MNGYILRKVAELPVTRWQYKGEPQEVRHIGPVAQDFYASFGTGEDDRYIGTIDADGVALAAIQGLYQNVQEKDCRIEELEDQQVEFKARLARLESLLHTTLTKGEKP
ncbi:MAG: tail fiber domain-containing protein [Candidatus Methylomirabilis sp.]